MLTTSPTALGDVAASTFARTTSVTNVKSRTCEPSPSSWNSSPELAARMSRWIAMSGRWGGRETREVAECDGRHREVCGWIAEHKYSPGQLGDAVRTPRLRQVRFGGRKVLGRPIDRRGGGVDEAIDGHPTGRLEQPLRDENIPPQVRLEIRAPRSTAHTRTSRNVKDDVDPVEQAIEVGLEQILLDEAERVEATSPPPRRLLHVPVVVVGEHVDSDDVVSVVEQLVAERTADEAGSTRNCDTHQSTSRSGIEQDKATAPLTDVGTSTGLVDPCSHGTCR